MKKTLIYIIATSTVIFLLLFSACKKDDNSQVVNPGGIGSGGGESGGSGSDGGNGSGGSGSGDVIKVDENLSNRNIVRAYAALDDENTLIIVWGDEVDDGNYIEIEYSDAFSGQDQTVKVGVDDDTSYVENLKLGETVKYQTAYESTTEGVDISLAPQETVVYTALVDKDLWGAADWSTIDPPLADDDHIKLEYVWDGVYSTDFQSPYGNFTSTRTDQNRYATDPTWITIDLGQTVQLDSFHVQYYRTFEGFCMRKYQIWGASEEDNSPGWDDWTKLKDVEFFQPSNQYKDYTEADANAWLNGSGGSIDYNDPKVRYIRIKCTQNYYVYWGEQGVITASDKVDDHNMEIQELTLWQVIGLDN